MKEMFGRQMIPGPTDGSAERRVPISRLRLIPPAARASFVPWLDQLPGLKVGENDLTRIAPGRPQAAGEVIKIGGSVKNSDQQPACGVLIEIWNANKWGRYVHIADPANQPLDPNFLGFGRAITDGEGRYSFLTIMPGAYLARVDIGRWRPSHVHFSIRGGSSRLITQMYFKGDPYLNSDPAFSLLGEAQPRHFGNYLGTDSGGIALYNWDIMLGGRNSSYFSHK